MDRQKFSPEMMFMKKADGTLPYSKQSATYNGHSAKQGQVKLLMGTALWLMNHWDTMKYKKIILVVAGGASGEHYDILLDMFPGIEELHLWDKRPEDYALKRPFLIDKYKGTNRVVFFNQGMTAEAAGDEYSKKKYNEVNIFFESDIRTMEVDGEEFSYIRNLPDTGRSDDIIMDDMIQQAEFVKAINPISCLLKFKVPYPYVKGRNTTKDTALYITYLKGVIYRQCFGGLSMAETRLACDRQGKDGWPTMNYDRREYEQKIFYYNMKNRHSSVLIGNHLTGSAKVYLENLLPCFDTCYAIFILDRYLWYIGYEENNPDVRLEKVTGLWKVINDGIGLDIRAKMKEWRRRTRETVGVIKSISMDMSEEEARQSLEKEEKCVKVPPALVQKKGHGLAYESTISIGKELPLGV